MLEVVVSEVGEQQAPGIAAVIVDGVVTALAELGYAASLAADGTIIEGTRADAMLDAAAIALDDPAIGCSTAKRIPIGRLGDLDYALVTSATLREGIDRLVRFYGVVTQRVKLSLVETNTLARLVFEREPNSTHSRHWAEFATAIIAERIRMTVGPEVTFEEVHFVHPPPPPSSAHDSFFGTHVRFNMPSDVLGFDKRLLSSPLRTAMTSLGEILEARLREIAKAAALRKKDGNDDSDGYVDRVRRVVNELLADKKVGLEETASRLHTSTRTLQRELKQRSTSHQEILDEVRRERAKELLERGETIAVVAQTLGFAEPSTFFRAFRRWTGKSPGEAMRKKSADAVD